MVKVSSLYDLDIYTITGQYVGRVADVVLNIRLGTISKLQVRAIEPGKKEVGIRSLFTNGFMRMPEEKDEVRTFKDNLLKIEFDKVQAIGDIMLIDPRDIKKVNPEPPIPEPVTPKAANHKQKRPEKHRVKAEKL